MLEILDPELGRKIRAIWTLVLGVVVAVVAVLQGVLDVLDSLPDWEVLGAVALWLRTLMSVLTTWTKVGTKAE